MSNSADSETFRFMARILADMAPQDVARLFAAASPLPSNPAAPAITSSPANPTNSNTNTNANPYLTPVNKKLPCTAAKSDQRT